MESLGKRFNRMGISPAKGARVPLVQNNRWNIGALGDSEKENKDRRRGCDSRKRWDNSAWKRPMSSGGISARVAGASPPPVYSVALVGGLKTFERAKEFHVACLASESMLQHTLDKIGFHGSIQDECSNIRGTNVYRVLITKSRAVDNDEFDYSIVLEATRQLSTSQKIRLLEIFTDGKISAAGFLEWLGGAKGWRFECAEKERVSWKRRFVIQLNTLQSVFTLFASSNQKYFFAEEKKRMVWRKKEELTDIVSDIRVWIEILEPSDLTHRLLRSSSSGPDSPVHWAHHHPVSHVVVPCLIDWKRTSLSLPPLKDEQIPVDSRIQDNYAGASYCK